MQRENDEAVTTQGPSRIDEFTTVRGAVERVMEEILDVTAIRVTARTGRWSLRRAHYRYPCGGEIRVYMTGIPIECYEELIGDIFRALEWTYGDGYVLLPVSTVTIDGRGKIDTIVIEVDRARINKTRPMPRRRRRL